ncbi:chromatin-remodeling ATPase INO80-like isoform X2 [Vicia villosa]|uniref:chromatin-remodeling ATPase INO80-like isoform X2 n=1 Tax=Vicia villosa TaxID=3911 RepID=UPI00273BC6B0|nr:chromatin-remodeling ATPase INO80-like isoform X2 [Vicia villosa]
MYEPSILEIGDGVTYKIPPVYDKLATSLNLLSFSDIHVDEFYLKGTWDLGLLAAMMASDKRRGCWKHKAVYFVRGRCIAGLLCKGFGKGDTYEIIEQSLPKKQKVKKDPASIEKKEMDRIGKIWAEVRKREEKEAVEALRREQELREAKRQRQRLNFLIQQTELYSHFMQF